MTNTGEMPQDWVINHLGEERENYLGAVAPPVFLTSNFCFPNLSAMRNALQKESSEPFYTRGTNPSLQMLEQKVAALEGGEAALLFASGSAAIAAAVCSCVSQGDHVICVEKPYSWTARLLHSWLGRFGVSVDFVEGTLASVQEVYRQNTKVLYLESPNSMTFEIQDIGELAQWARPLGIQIIVDNSYATPLFQQPLLLGADMVVHSATKYFSGHSDAVGGILVCRQSKREEIFASEYMTLGGTMSPMNAWLILRGLRTLPLRLKKSHETGMAMAEWLSKHPKIKQLRYPLHPSHPQWEIAKKQMKGSGGLLSFKLDTDQFEKVETFCNSLKYFLLACSWGGYESLCFPSAALQISANYPQKPENIGLIRIYCGLEDFENLKADIDNALFLSQI